MHGIVPKILISEEEDDGKKLLTSSSNVADKLKQLNLNTQTRSVCLRDEINMRYKFHHYAVMSLKLCGHCHTTVLGDINEQHVGAVRVFELLNTLNCAVQLLPMLARRRLRDCVDVDAQLLLVSSTSASV